MLEYTGQDSVEEFSAEEVTSVEDFVPTLPPGYMMQRALDAFSSLSKDEQRMFLEAINAN
jgi:hypothetical protein